MRRFARFPTLATSLALVLGAAGSALANDSYVRFEQGDSMRDGALQVAVGTFVHPEKDVKVQLYGVVHIADAAYYARVQKDLDASTVVLYEGVAPGKGEADEGAKGLGDMQHMMGEMLGLSFQKDGINYKRPNLVHSDMNMDEFKEAMGGGSINPMGQFMSEDQMKNMLPMMKMAMKMGAMFMKNNPAMQDNMKMMMGKQMGNADMNNALGQKMTQAILIDRNKTCIGVFDRELPKLDSGTITFFWGAAHNPDLADRLAERGWKLESKRWMSAWTIGQGVGADEPAPAPSPTPQPTGPRWF